MNNDEKVKIDIMPPNTLQTEDRDDIISNYITVNPRCICCTLPRYAMKINEAYLNGYDYEEIVNMFADKIERDTGKKLNVSIISKHFSSHFNYKGAAVAEYNRRKGIANLPVEQQKSLKDVFKILVDERINDIELLELSMKQQITRMQELEKIKKDRIEENRLDGIEDLIMKQELVMNNLQTQVLTKLKIQSQAFLKSKELDQNEKFLKFLDPKTADFLGVDSLNPVISRQIEQIYIKVVIEKVLLKIKDATNMALNLTQQQKVDYFKELERQWSGIEQEINGEYERRVKNLKEVKS